MNIETMNDGESVIALYLKRTKEGLQVNIQTAVAVEEFFKHWGGQQKRSVASIGRMWKSPTVLQAWEIMRIDDLEDRPYTITQLGQDITKLGNGVNISFLRLIGTSEPGGVTFVVDNVVSRTGLERLANQLNLSCGRFYDEYMKPAQVDITVSVRQRE